jgi:glycosyltransferase involved in cell wall biosynthesis
MANHAVTVLNKARTQHTASGETHTASFASSLAPAELSIVVPAFNEGRRLSGTLPKIREIAESVFPAEIIVVDDGSNDDTLAVCGSLLSDSERCEVVWHPKRRGKGAAVKSGVERARGRYVAFVDADISPDLESGLRLGLELLGDHEVAIASRALAGAEIRNATLYRKALGLGFRLAQKTIVGLPYDDTQCGLKLFSAPAAKVIFHFVKTSGFAFDVEVLRIAALLGLRVGEFPIEWTAHYPSRVRGLRDGARMFLDLVKIRLTEFEKARPVPCVWIQNRDSSPVDLADLRRCLRRGDIVIESESGVYVLMFSSPPVAARAAAARLSQFYGDTSRVTPAALSPLHAFELAKRWFAEKDSRGGGTVNEPA